MNDNIIDNSIDLSWVEIIYKFNFFVLGNKLLTNVILLEVD